MRLKIRTVREGLHPSEMIVSVETVDNNQQFVVVAKRSISADGTIEVGFIGKRDQDVLVELPRETETGAWRVWVPERLTVDRVAA